MTERELHQFYHSREFKDSCVYEGHDLGVVCGEEGSVFKVWSPVADEVVLCLYPEGEGEERICSIPMVKGEMGVWAYRTGENLHGVYYDYEVTVCGITQRTADPYARACGVNGRRSMAVEPGRTDPEGWEYDRAPEKQPEDVIYEVHVKEFSWDESGGFKEEHRGRYLAFTETDTTLYGDGIHPTGIAYLKQLGVTHVQLMPVFDFGSVDEAGEREEFNWGYDPVCYNVPEGSYSSDPFHGEVRIRELKEAIRSLHENGFRVIMDVVYNHTYSADSWFERTVPGYYYRQKEDGSLSDGSSCGNDFASEREMAAGFILDSVLYWAEEYHMDGFRFDLMGLLDTELMNRIKEELDRRYGRGEKLIYGEPWAADSTAMEAGFIQALKMNGDQLNPSIGFFCDDTRDVIKGHVFESGEPGFVNGREGLEREILRAAAGWCGGHRGKMEEVEVGGKERNVERESRGTAAFRAVSPERIINYVSAHDNLTLWDKLILTMAPEEGFYSRPEEVVRASKLAASICFTCQGRIFFLSGEEFARTKEGDDNSFQAPVELNRLDYGRALEFDEMVQFYQNFIALRKRLPGLCDKSEHAYRRIFAGNGRRKGVVSFCVDNRGLAGSRSAEEGARRWDTLFIAYNSRKSPILLRLPEGDWEVLVKDGDSGIWKKRPFTVVNGSVTMEPLSAAVFGIVPDRR